MPDLRLPGDLLEPARATFERGAVSAPATMPLEPAAIAGVRTALEQAAETGQGEPVQVTLTPEELEVFRACFIAGGEHAQGLDEACWRAILAAIDAAEGAPRPGIA